MLVLERKSEGMTSPSKIFKGTRGVTEPIQRLKK